MARAQQSTPHRHAHRSPGICGYITGSLLFLVATFIGTSLRRSVQTYVLHNPCHQSHKSRHAHTRQTFQRPVPALPHATTPLTATAMALAAIMLASPLSLSHAQVRTKPPSTTIHHSSTADKNVTSQPPTWHPATTKQLTSQQSPASKAGYWLAQANGSVNAYGGVPYYGSATGQVPANNVVAMATTSNSGGYWLATSTGAVYAFGNAAFHGSLNLPSLNAPIVGIAPTPNGRGYWLVASDGGVFAFGDAVFYGSLAALHLNAPIVGIAATASGQGYWLAGADGGIFNFGDAQFYGSLGGSRLNAPITAISATSNSAGYRLVASDGGVFCFGDARFYGSAVGPSNNSLTNPDVTPGQIYLGTPPVAKTTTTLTLSLPILTQGGTSQAIATVKFGSRPVSSGLVTFTIPGSTLGTAPLANGKATLSLPTQPAPGAMIGLGVTTITASFQATPGYTGSSATAVITTTAPPASSPPAGVSPIINLTSPASSPTPTPPTTTHPSTTTPPTTTHPSTTTPPTTTHPSTTTPPTTTHPSTTTPPASTTQVASPTSTSSYLTSGTPTSNLLDTTSTSLQPVAPIVSITSRNGGYWLVSDSGKVFPLGNATAIPTSPGPLRAKVVAVVAANPAAGQQHSLVTGLPDVVTSGTYGSDVSNWQCGDPQPQSEGLNIVEVDGQSNSAPNPCLSAQFHWASAGSTQLYTFLSYGTQSTGPALCDQNQACNFGYAAAQNAYRQATEQNVSSPVWWLDIEKAQRYWSTDHEQNAQVIKGALAGLSQKGITVGIYSSQAEWSSITSGTGFSPKVPQWVSDWQSNAPPFNPASECNSSYAFTSGPVKLVQYSNGLGTNGVDDDYVC